MRKISLCIGALLLIIVTTLPLGHASVNYGLFFLSSTSQSGCSVKCEQLLRTSGSADTVTSVKDAKTVGNFPVDPDVGSSTTTATEGSGTDGNAWVFSTDLGGVQIQSGTWTFKVTTTATSATGTAFIHIQVFSCLTASEGTCTRLLTLDDAGTNIQGTTTATQRTYSGTFGPFNVHFLTVEYWVDQTVASGSTTETITITTVSSASSVQTPQWNEPLAQSVTLASSKTNVANHPRALAQSITISSLLTHLTSWKLALAQSITDASSFVKVAAHIYSLTQSVTSSSILAKIAAHIYSLTQSVTSSSTLAKVAAHIYSLAQSVTSSSSLAKVAGHIYSLTQSISSSSSFSRLVNYGDSFTQSITDNSALSNPANHFRSLIQSLVIGSSGTKGFSFALTGNIQIATIFSSWTNHFYSLPQTIDILSKGTNCEFTLCYHLNGFPSVISTIQASLVCNLASSRCSTGGAGIALAIIGVGIAGVALFLALNKGKSKTRYSYKRRRRF